MRSLCLAIALVPALALSAAAQVKVDVTAPGVRVAGGAEAKAGMAHRTSKIIGMAVKNPQNEDLGKIEDLVIDENGQVRYAAISFGGFLGFNNKLFAVPFRALKIKHDAGSSSHYIEINKVSKAHLEAIDGFPSDKWPDFSNVEMNNKIDAHWLKPEAPTTTLPRDK